MRNLFAIAAAILLTAATVNCEPDFEARQVEDEANLEQMLDIMQAKIEEDDNGPVRAEAPHQSRLRQLLAALIQQGRDDEEAMTSIQISKKYNKPDEKLNVECDTAKGESMIAIRSVYSAREHDRQWAVKCGKVSSTPLSDCFFTKELNELDGPLLFMCPSNSVMSGISSIHNNYNEDRVWNVKCCRARGYYTESCDLTNRYINDLRGTLKYSVKPAGAITGLYSYHDNKQQDRRWKVLQCKFTTDETE